MVATRLKTAMVAMAIGLFAIALFLCVQPAYASDRAQLQAEYQSALLNYENALGEQEQNAAEIVQVESDIEKTERAIERSRDDLGDTASALYKSKRKSNELVDLILGAGSFQDAVMRYETYERIEKYYYEQINKYVREQERLTAQRTRLERRKVELEQKVSNAKQAADDAHAALMDNLHLDGGAFHQTQGNGSNCGATAFIVGVNILLHESRYTDNVGVWNGPGFNGDSTTDLAYRSNVWLVANGLSGIITAEQLAGDIHSAAQLREQLEQGYLVVTSSGPGSVFYHADGGHAPEGSYPDGHWILFYCYQDGVYYANDSAVETAKGAGVPYSEEQVQQWLDGRGNHFSTVLKKL